MTKSDLKHSLKYIEKFYKNIRDTKYQTLQPNVLKHTVDEDSDAVYIEDG